MMFAYQFYNKNCFVFVYILLLHSFSETLPLEFIHTALKLSDIHVLFKKKKSANLGQSHLYQILD